VTEDGLHRLRATSQSGRPWLRLRDHGLGQEVSTGSRSSTSCGSRGKNHQVRTKLTRDEIEYKILHGKYVPSF
jgi:hypothetical protein